MKRSRNEIKLEIGSKGFTEEVMFELSVEVKVGVIQVVRVRGFLQRVKNICEGLEVRKMVKRWFICQSLVVGNIKYCR